MKHKTRHHILDSQEDVKEERISELWTLSQLAVLQFHLLLLIAAWCHFSLWHAGWVTLCPPKDTLKPWILGTLKVTSFGNGVFANLIKVKMRSLGWDLIQCDWCFHKKKTRAQRHKEKALWRQKQRVQRSIHHPDDATAGWHEPGENHGIRSPPEPSEHQSHQHPHFGLLAPRSVRKINLRLTAPSVQCLLIGSLGN